MNLKSSSLLFAISVATALAQTGLSQTDTLLRWAAGALDPEFNYASFKNISRQDAARLLTPIIAEQPSNTSGYFLASLLLACKGIDLRANTERVLKPALVWKENSTREFKSTNGLAPNAVLLEDVPRALFLIVKTQKYQPAVKALITMPSDGAVAENQDDCIMDLLKQEPVTVMRLAAQDKAIYDKLVDTIDWNVGSPASRSAFLGKLAAVRWPNTALRRKADALIRTLKKPIHRTYAR
jgi:hypothetical protein